MSQPKMRARVQTNRGGRAAKHAWALNFGGTALERRGHRRLVRLWSRRYAQLGLGHWTAGLSRLAALPSASGRRSRSTSLALPYSRYRFPADIIQRAAWISPL